MRHLCLMLIVAALLAAAGTASAQQIKYGKWEITTKVNMVGMPMDMPPMTRTQCLTEEDLTPRTEQPNDNCTTDYTVDGNTVHFTMACDTPEGKLKGEGMAIYEGETMKGSLTMVMHGENEMEMTHDYEGHYLGPCDE